jgi:sec-independent protein translocase protein TatC
MAKLPNDDLFRDSTMTFGEHLEELRAALFRALIALVLGFLIALMFAKYVVGWIKKPLSDALERYYSDSALMQLDEEYLDDPPREMLSLIEEGWIPERIRIEPFGVLEKIKNAYPSQFEHLKLVPHQFALGDLAVENVVPLCRQLATGSHQDASAMQVIWTLLSEHERRRVGALADQEEVSPAERREVVDMLNGLLGERSLHQGESFRQLAATIGDDRTRSTAESIHRQLDQGFDADASTRLNRLLLDSAFTSSLRPPRSAVVELVTWKRVDAEVQSLSVHEGFMIWIKAALISGLIIASPWVFWQIWDFVAAGLYPHEKRFVHIFLPFSLGLFLAGAALAFFFVFQPVLDFLLSFNRKMDIDAAPRISEWLNFVMFLPLGFGVSFQLPLVMLFLERIGVFTIHAYISKWRVAILVIFVVSMFLTPADPVSMLLMAVPLTFLYFGGILLCRWMPRRGSPLGEGYEP